MARKSSTGSKPDFTTYFREHGSILQTKYPFLTASQIKGKARDIWKKLPAGEKPVQTPAKSQQQSKTSTPKQKPSSKTKKKDQEIRNITPKIKESEEVDSSPTSTPASSASFEVKFQGIGEMGYTAGRKFPSSKTAPDVVHTHPISTTSILRSSEKNKAHNVSFTSPSQWISRSMTESPADTTPSTSHKNSGSEELFNDDARDDSSQELAYGIGSDDSDVDKSNQLNALHTKALRSKKKTNKTPVKKEKTAKNGAKKTAIKNENKKPVKKGSLASGRRKSTLVQKNTIDNYVNTLKGSDIDSESEASCVVPNMDMHHNLPFLTGSQSTNNNTDDNDSDHDKEMMLAQLYVEKKGAKKAGRTRKKTPKKELSFEKVDVPKSSRKSKKSVKKKHEDDCISFGSPLLKLKKQQDIKHMADNCFGFNCDSPEPEIVSIVPLRDIQNISDRDAVVVVQDQIVESEDKMDEDNTPETDNTSIDSASQKSVEIEPENKPSNKSVNRRSRRLGGEELSNSQENESTKENVKVEVKGRRRRGEASEDSFKTPNIPGLGVKDLKQKNGSATPQLTTDIVPNKIGKKGEDRTTTPLMPEALVQKTIQQAVASPRKRKRSPKPNQHDHSASANSNGENARPRKCARKSLIDEKDELNENKLLLSPFDKRKQGIPNTNRIRLTPRPRKQREQKTKSEKTTRCTRNSLARDRSLNALETSPTVQDSRAKKPKAPPHKGNTASKPPKQTFSPSDNTPSSVESEEELEGYNEKPWKAPLLQAAATYQLATKYKELDTFDSIFDNDEEESEERTTKVASKGTSGALAEAMRAMREAAKSAEEEVESVEVTSDLTSSPSQLSAVSPAVSGVTELSDEPANMKHKQGFGTSRGEGMKEASPECSGDMVDSGKDTAEEQEQGDLQPYMKQLQHSVEQSLMDMFDDPKPSTSTNRRNLSSGYVELEEDSSDQQDSGSDIFL